MNTEPILGALCQNGQQWYRETSESRVPTRESKTRKNMRKQGNLGLRSKSATTPGPHVDIQEFLSRHFQFTV